MRVTNFLVVGCLGLGAIVVARQHSSSNAELARLQQKLTDLSRSQRFWQEQQRAQDGATMLGLRAAVLNASAAPVRSAEAAVPAPEQVVPEASDPPVTPQSDQERADEELARVDASFESERYDAPWASQAQVQVQKGVVEEGGATVRRVECRSTLCRAELEHADGQGREKFIQSLLIPTRFWKGEVTAMAQATPGGGLRTVAFFARDGRSF